MKDAAIHSWKAYEEHAWGVDELQPVTLDGKQTLGGLGATIIDSLTTLWLMDLKPEFARHGTHFCTVRNAKMLCSGWNNGPAGTALFLPCQMRPMKH